MPVTARRLEDGNFLDESLKARTQLSKFLNFVP
jgi:hypothetical protein